MIWIFSNFRSTPDFPKFSHRKPNEERLSSNLDILKSIEQSNYVVFTSDICSEYS
ncbi:hypothetical protein EV07_1910 [Prochlorococcus sp. MIT 0603]|nr:hypothetical protein EV07_1910 [Prochlorococcus sp. MIT 0603]